MAVDIGITINDDVTMRASSSGALGRIDQYELLRELGGGGFGTVFLARDTVSGIDVAVKGLPPMVRNNKEELENVRQNFVLVSRLHDEHIAAALVLHPVKEAVYSERVIAEKLRVFEGDYLVVMEYAPGVTLSQWRKQFQDGKVPVEKVRQIVAQIAHALDYAHEKRIIHRDIKPANVMIETRDDGSLVARVLDFGLAAEVRSSMGRVSQQVTDTSGTRPYMAPEQWLGKKQGPATDQYALAVLAYELLTGEVPFASVFDTGDPVLMKNVVGVDQPEFVSDLPKSVRKALSTSLAKDPARRFPSCGAFAAALGGDAGSSRMTRFPWLTVALLVFVLIGGVFAWQRHSKKIELAEVALRQAEANAKAEIDRIHREEARKQAEYQAEKRRADDERKKIEENAKRAETEAAKLRAEAEARRRAEEAERKAEEAKLLAEQAEAKRKAEAAEAKRLAEVEAKRRAEAEKLRREEEAKRKAEEAKRAANYLIVDLIDGSMSYQASLPQDAIADVYKSSKLVLRKVEPGTFTMGSPLTEANRDEEEKPHQVRLTKPYFIGIFETTQAQWEHIAGNNPSQMKSPTRPVENVSYLDVYELFLKVLRQRTKSEGFELPTEAQWEYACRAGTTTALPNGRDWVALGQNNVPAIDEIGWYGGNAGVDYELANGCGNFGAWQEKQYDFAKCGTHPVAKKQPNRWGLYDMIGNVGELCRDWYGAYAGEYEVDPQGPANPKSEYSKERVVRGGCWRSSPKNGATCCRSAERTGRSQEHRCDTFGFRIIWQDPSLSSKSSQSASPKAEPVAETTPKQATKPLHSAGETKTVTLPGGAKLELVWCPPGSFTMGSPASEEGRGNNETLHRVTLTKGFWMGKYEIAQRQWESVMGSNPSRFKGERRPVESVSWTDCQEFCRKAGIGLRLPTEAEWEYACRAGTATAYNFGNALNGDKANCDGHFPCGTTEKGTYNHSPCNIGSYQPNNWGLYDMHGNVWEWCQDWYGEYGGAVTDPFGPASGKERVLRGGSWNGSARRCRSAIRGNRVPGHSLSYIGFRVCCSADAPILGGR